MKQSSLVAVVDDDLGIREALDSLIRSFGYESRMFGSAEEYLDTKDRSDIDCILLDVKMTGMNGIELQSCLNRERTKPPIIFMTSYQDEKTRAAAMMGGALAFLAKPVNVERLIHFVNVALQRDRTASRESGRTYCCRGKSGSRRPSRLASTAPSNWSGDPTILLLTI